MDEVRRQVRQRSAYSAMWVPRDVIELRTRLEAGTLEETSTFDGKREIPKDNLSTAVDLAPMTVQGGVIVYGIGEEPSGTRLTEATPVPLTGARERLDQIAQTAIAEPPQLSITTLEEPDRPGEGSAAEVISRRPPARRVEEGPCRHGSSGEPSARATRPLGTSLTASGQLWASTISLS